MNNIIIKTKNFQNFINSLYIKLNKLPPTNVKNILEQEPLTIIATLKTTINYLQIGSAADLYNIIKQNVEINDKDLAKLSADEISKLERYSEYFYCISKII